MMRKFFVALLVGAVAVGLAAPAFAADLKFTGAYRVRGQFDNNLPCMSEQVVAGVKTDCSGNEFQTRFRPKFTVETDGGVTGVLHLEIGDVRFGNTASEGKGSGGGFGADGLNVETKWAYIDFPVPATPLRLRAGIQPFFLSKALILDDDGSGLSLYGKLGEINANAWWIRPSQTKVAASGLTKDERDLYGLDLSFSPAKDLSLNAYLVYDHDSATPPAGVETFTGFWFGVGAAGKVQNIRYDLDFVYSTKDLTATTEQTGWMLDGGVGMALAGTPLDLEVRGWWATGEKDGIGDSDAFLPISGQGHEPGTQVWGGGGAIDIDNLADNAQNTWGLGLIARYTVSPTLKLTGNVHYIGTVEEGTATFASPAGDGKIGGVSSIGTEVGVKVDYTIARGLVFTLTAGHLFLGDDTPIVAFGGITKFDDVTKVAGVVNYGF